MGEERWTPATEDLVATAMHAEHATWDTMPLLYREQARNCAELALTALADAGLLVTPQTRAVLDAARAWVQYHEQRLKPIGAGTGPGFALAAAVEALDEESR